MYSSSAVDQSALRPMSSQQSKVQRKRTTSLGSTSENDEDDEGWKSDENVTPETRKEIKHPPGFSLEVSTVAFRCVHSVIFYS